MKPTYLASPYSHRQPDVVSERVQGAIKAAVHLFRQGVVVYSPIIHNHVLHLNMPESVQGFDYWAKHDLTMLSVCGDLIVLTLDGWLESRGVAAEIAEAGRLDIPITYLDPLA